MTNATDKLIADNLWRDISEAPRGSPWLLVKTEAWIKVAFRNGDYWFDDIAKPLYFTPTPFLMTDAPARSR